MPYALQPRPSRATDRPGVGTQHLAGRDGGGQLDTGLLEPGDRRRRLARTDTGPEGGRLHRIRDAARAPGDLALFLPASEHLAGGLVRPTWDPEPAGGPEQGALGVEHGGPGIVVQRG